VKTQSRQAKIQPVLLKIRKQPVADFSSLISSYTSKELASPKRSTVPLLAYWAQPEARFRELCPHLGLDPSGPLEFHFEFPVPVQRGTGKASFTDLMILSPTFAVAIEAKFTEPAYEIVEDWLATHPSQTV